MLRDETGLDVPQQLRPIGVRQNWRRDRGLAVDCGREVECREELHVIHRGVCRPAREYERLAVFQAGHRWPSDDDEQFFGKLLRNLSHSWLPDSHIRAAD